MNPRDQAALLDIATAARLALEFTADMGKGEFEGDRKTQSAVLYQLAIIGEAVKRLSSDFRDQHPDVAWRAIAGMRDKLVHDYDGVNIDRVWLTLESSIPDLLTVIAPLLPSK